MQSHYRVVIVGGGVVGASVLYHLAKLGWTDVAPVEREKNTAPQRLVTLEVDALDADASGYEPVWKDSRRVGFVTSGGDGHHVGKSLAMALVDVEHASPSRSSRSSRVSRNLGWCRTRMSSTVVS